MRVLLADNQTKVHSALRLLLEQEPRPTPSSAKETRRNGCWQPWRIVGADGTVAAVALVLIGGDEEKEATHDNAQCPDQL